MEGRTQKTIHMRIQSQGDAIFELLLFCGGSERLHYQDQSRTSAARYESGSVSTYYWAQKGGLSRWTYVQRRELAESANTARSLART